MAGTEERAVVQAVQEVKRTTENQTSQIVRAVQDAATTTTPTYDVNGFSRLQKACAGGAILTVFMSLCVMGADWGKSMLTDMINHSTHEAAVERQRSDERESRSREHGDKAIEVLRSETLKQTERIEKALHDVGETNTKAIHGQTLMMDRSLQKSYEIQKEMIDLMKKKHRDNEAIP